MFWSGQGCKLPRGQAVEARVRTVQVIVVSPVFDNLPRMAVAREEVLVEAFITQTSIEAFH